jgi:hypothetical protein
MSNLPAFSMDEALLLCDALKGVLCTGATLYGNVASACTYAPLAEKWHVDQAALLQRINGLSLEQAQAVVDAVARVWDTPEYHVDLRERVVEVGLVSQGEQGQERYNPHWPEP